MRLKHILLTPALIVWFAFTAHADSLAVSGTATFYPTPSTISPVGPIPAVPGPFTLAFSYTLSVDPTNTFDGTSATDVVFTESGVDLGTWTLLYAPSGQVLQWTDNAGLAFSILFQGFSPDLSQSVNGFIGMDLTVATNCQCGTGVGGWRFPPNVSTQQITLVSAPEPASLTLLALGILALGALKLKSA